MATLIGLKYVCKHLNMKPVVSNSEIILSGISKIYIEHKLLGFEYGSYVSTLGMLTNGLEYKYPGLNLLVVGVSLVGLPGIYFIPVFRCWKSYKKSTLQILNLIK